MKTIRVLRNTGNHLPRFAEGQVVDVPDQTADLLCGLNLAELLKTVPDQPLMAIPDNPSVLAAEDKLQEIKDRWTSGRGANESPPQPAPKSKRQPKTKSDSKE
jgi:hypothetical protein